MKLAYQQNEKINSPQDEKVAELLQQVNPPSPVFIRDIEGPEDENLDGDKSGHAPSNSHGGD